MRVAIEGRGAAMRAARIPIILAGLALAALMTACSSIAPRFGDTPEQSRALLQSHAWRLAAAFDAEGAPDHRWSLAGHAPLELLFLRSRLAVQGLCGSVEASYGSPDRRLDVGTPTWGEPVCTDPALARLGQRAGLRLPELRRHALHGGQVPRLVLFFADGGRWELDGAPSLRARYASPGERVFLEVAPWLMDCPYGLMKNARCLRVRDVDYDAHGVPYAMGPWQPFHGVVQGYAHEPGAHDVLRIQRFRQQNPPPDGRVYAYVLDGVVERTRLPVGAREQP